MKETKLIRIYVEDEKELFKLKKQLSTLDSQLSYADVVKLLIKAYKNE